MRLVIKKSLYDEFEKFFKSLYLSRTGYPGHYRYKYAPDKGDNLSGGNVDSVNDDKLTESEKEHFKDLLSATVEPFKPTNGTVEEFKSYLGKPMETPLGIVKMGANQYSKFIEKNRGNLFIAAKETLENPSFIFRAENGTKVYVKSFVSDNGKKKNILSATIERDGIGISITTHEERINQILSKIKKTGILYEKVPSR